MATNPTLCSHAISRLLERFGVDESWLMNELNDGRFVWLKGSGNSEGSKRVRSGHLFYIPHRDDYCIVVMDDRSRAAITVLTEAMALNSPWGKGVHEAAKLKAKRLALGEKSISDGNFIRLYAEERLELLVSVRATSVAYNWMQITIPICKAKITADQVDIETNSCAMTEDQVAMIVSAIGTKIKAKEMREYCDIYICTAGGKRIPISNTIDKLLPLSEAANARRWV